ncbi:MAG: PDZ domain-containing protein [Planctomycetota bacterium]
MRIVDFVVFATLAGCSLAPEMPERSPALGDVEEPLELRGEPDDEAQRRALPAGSFSGLVVDDARDTLAAKLDQPGALRVVQVIENSPAAAAGLLVDDLLLEAKVGDGAAVALQRPSEWRQIELTTPPGAAVTLFVDRAGREARAEMTLVQRLQPAPRGGVERLREEQRVGVVLRGATEVEARGAGLGPGGGAVVVGLSRASPWRTAGVRFGDLLTAIDGKAIAHPQDLLAALRDTAADEVVLQFVRAGERREVQAPLTGRDRDLNELTVPLLFSYASGRGVSEFSFLLGLVNYRSTAAAWRFRLFWLFAIGAGDTDRLIEVGT